MVPFKDADYRLDYSDEDASARPGNREVNRLQASKGLCKLQAGFCGRRSFSSICIGPAAAHNRPMAPPAGLEIYFYNNRLLHESESSGNAL
jgi:hypothetical protein